MLGGPVMKGHEVVFVCQLTQCSAPIVPDFARGRTGFADQGWQVRRQVVPAPRPELLEKVSSPVGSVHFEAVTENGVGRMRSESLHQAVTYGMQVVLDCVEIVM